MPCKAGNDDEREKMKDDQKYKYYFKVCYFDFPIVVLFMHEPATSPSSPAIFVPENRCTPSEHHVYITAVILAGSDQTSKALSFIFAT